MPYAGPANGSAVEERCNRRRPANGRLLQDLPQGKSVRQFLYQPQQEMHQATGLRVRR